MTDEVFTELVDLYLDQEISKEDLARLRAELAANPERKESFLERRCLHRATRLALAPEDESDSLSVGLSGQPSHSKRRRGASTGRSRRRRSHRHRVSGSSGSSGSRRLQREPQRFQGLALGAGMAASLLIASVLLTPVFRDSLSGPLFSNDFWPAEKPGSLGEDILPVELRASDLERYGKMQARAQQRQASLVAQMRLMGLRPELTPLDKQLRTVEASSLKMGQNKISRAEHLERLQQLSPIPAPKLFQNEASGSELQADWDSGGFDVHLVGY